MNVRKYAGIDFRFSKMNVSKVVTPSEFLKITRIRPNSIKSSRIIPPKLGSDSLGEIYVEFYHEPK